MINKFSELELRNVDDVPIAFYQPHKDVANGSLAIWVPYLGGNRETGIKELQMLTAAGYFALSLDPYLHGDRQQAKSNSVVISVFRNFRAVMWPILGITTLDIFRIIDWALNNFNLNDAVVINGG